MGGLKKPRYLKIHDIHSILKYIFLGYKRPHYIQLNPKPRLVVLLHAKNVEGDLHAKAEPNPNINVEKNVSDGKQSVRQADIQKDHLIEAHLNEGIPLDDLFGNILKSVDARRVSLSTITPDNLKLIEKHDITHLFSYTNFIESRVDFDVTRFETFLRPTKASPYFLLALDCEMMICRKGRQIGRISIVDHTGEVIYDRYVRPDSEVIDYVEKYSGLNYDNTSRGVSLSQMRKDMLELIGTNTFLLGHGLEHDLEAMSFYTENVIDTAYLFLSSEGHKTKLAQLSKKYFGKVIQETSHSSREDALCCLKLLSYRISQIRNIYDPEGELLDLGVETRRVASFEELDGGRGIRVVETQSLTLGNLWGSRDVFYMVFYSKDTGDYVAMNQKTHLK